MTDNKPPFSLLPAALVGELMSMSQDVGKLLLSQVREITYKREDIRRQLSESGFLRILSRLPDAPSPTTVGVDGTHVVDRLLGTDLVTCVAIAVEGLAPPSETEDSNVPFHKIYVHPEPHNADTGIVSRGILWELETVLAANLPHDIVFINGPMANPFLCVSGAYSKARDIPESGLVQELVRRLEEFLTAYNTVLAAAGRDKFCVGVPKYSSKREIGSNLGWPDRYSDLAILTFLLEPGEYTFPVPCEQSQDPSHTGEDEDLFGVTGGLKHLFKEVIDKMNNLHLCYFKPHTYTPAVRLEIPKSVISNDDKLSMLLQAVRVQCGSPCINEPYPLHMANKMVKDIASAIPAFRETATREMPNGFEVGHQEIFNSTHNL